MATRHPDRLIVNGRWDPRDGDDGPPQARGGPRRSTASRASSLHGRVEGRIARLEARPPRSCEPLLGGVRRAQIKNMHVHKGPTIWPLDKDAFNVADVDKVANR